MVAEAAVLVLRLGQYFLSLETNRASIAINLLFVQGHATGDNHKNIFQRAVSFNRLLPPVSSLGATP